MRKLLHNIISGYGRLLLTAGKVVFLLIICLGMGALIVLPLWKWATSSPSTYTAVVLTAAILSVCISIALRLVRYVNSADTPAERRSNLLHVIRVFLSVLILLSGVAFCVVSVLADRKPLAAVCFILLIVLYGAIAFGVKGKKQASGLHILP